MAVSTKKFGTLEGVFTPCLLSILGVIMYLRLGWVVGNVGFVGALIIICIANLITLATTLSMSSIVSNIRIGTGGAYSIIKNSLGMEAGGAIGFPLYIAQAISVAFYIAGFSECWLFVFPSHNVLLVSLILWFFLLVITYTSTKVAFRVQYLIMGLIGLSLVSIFSGEGIAGTNVFIQETLPGENFWGVFAVFFPAVTGILVGASMSGELKDPKSSIPQGTLWAIIISFCIYVGLAFFFAKKVPLADLQTNLSVAIDLGRWSWLVIIGIMGGHTFLCFRDVCGISQNFIGTGEAFRGSFFSFLFAHQSKGGAKCCHSFYRSFGAHHDSPGDLESNCGFADNDFFNYLWDDQFNCFHRAIYRHH